MRRMPRMEPIWRDEDFIGDNRPVIRATITRPMQKLFTYGLRSLGLQPEVTISSTDATAVDNLARNPQALFEGEDVTEVYATHWVHDDQQPLELPNIQTCSWTRSVDQDAAEMTLVMLNVHPASEKVKIGPGRELRLSWPGRYNYGIGDSVYDLDQLGFFSPSRGATQDSARWGHHANAWAGLLMPDNIIKTFQGYGVDWNVQPESDPHLAQTGVWMIDEIKFTAAGNIEIRCRDLGRLLLQHGFEAPVLPNDFNPTGFKAWTTAELTRTVNVETTTTETVKEEFTWSDPAVYQRTRHPLTNPHSSTEAWVVGTNGDGGPGQIKDAFKYHGRGPQDTLDDNGSTFWISVGNGSPRASFAYEWVEFDLPGATLNEVMVHVVKSGYQCFISVMRDGQWLGNQRINYREAGVGRNGSNIPFIAQAGVNDGRNTLGFAPIDRAQRVRITLGNLQDWGANFSGFRFRAAIASVEAYATSSHPGATHTEYRERQETSTSTDKKQIILPPGAVGENPGKGAARYSDFTDIIKLICAWGGFYWPQDVLEATSNSTVDVVDSEVPGFFDKPLPQFRRYHFTEPDTGVLGHVPGRVWGDFMSTGQSGPAPIDASNFKAKSLMDGIHYFQDIVSFNFWIDEFGACQWRYPNIDNIGCWISDNSQYSGRVPEVWDIDEKQLITDMATTLSSRRLAEIVILKNLVDKVGYVSEGYNPNPTGLRRSVIWNDAEHLVNAEEAKIMGDLTAVRMLFSYRTNTVRIPGFPGIQIDDQIRLHERTTSDSFYHLITSIQSEHDNTTGTWNYTMNTMWLGDTPEGRWVVERGKRTVRDNPNVATDQVIVDRGGRTLK